MHLTSFLQDGQLTIAMTGEIDHHCAKSYIGAIEGKIDDDNYVITDDRNYRYFGGIFENLAIKTELVSLFQCINDVTEDTMKELKDYLKTL